MNIIVHLQFPDREDSTLSGSIISVINISPNKGVCIQIDMIRGRNMGCDGFSHPTCSIQYVIRIGLVNLAKRVIYANSSLCDQFTPLSQNSKCFESGIRAKDTSLKPKEKRLQGVIVIKTLYSLWHYDARKN